MVQRCRLLYCTLDFITMLTKFEKLRNVRLIHCLRFGKSTWDEY